MEDTEFVEKIFEVILNYVVINAVFYRYASVTGELNPVFRFVTAETRIFLDFLIVFLHTVLNCILTDFMAEVCISSGTLSYGIYGHYMCLDCHGQWLSFCCLPQVHAH